LPTPQNIPGGRNRIIIHRALRTAANKNKISAETLAAASLNPAERRAMELRSERFNGAGFFPQRKLHVREDNPVFGDCVPLPGIDFRFRAGDFALQFPDVSVA